MNIYIKPPTRPAVIGWAAALSALPGIAAASDDSAANLTLWLASLPDWAFPLALTLLFTGLALLGLKLLRSWRDNTTVKFISAFGGAALGLLLAIATTDSWQGYLTESIAQFPSTAAGKPDHVGGGRPVALLEDPDSDGASRRPELPQKALQGRARHAKVNFDALDADSLELNLFEDTVLVAVRDRIVKNIQGGDVWVGHIDGDANSQVVLAVKGRTLMGTVEYNERAFEIVFAGGATHAVRELDPNSLPAQFEPEESEYHPDIMEGDTSSGDSSTTSGDTVASSGQVIDVLVVYTPKSRTNAGGASGIESKIINAVTRANQAYLNSKVNIQLNLVGMAETNFTETGSMSTAVSQLRSTTDGIIDEVHTLRNQVGADIVMLITADTDSCGVAYRMTSLSSAFASNAFGVVHDDSKYNCLGSNNTFAHEIGHIQGNMHDAANSTGTPIYPDSYGYQVCGNYRSIMSYSCTGETRIPYFANPDVYWNGFPTGVVNSANTVRSMNATASTIASFRATATVATVPTAPGNLAAAATSSSSIVLTWTDSASDESGFIVQASADGATWNQVAALSANAVSFTHSGLTAGQTYNYRVYAYNSVGNSALSNTASATTQAAAAPAPEPVAPVVDSTPPVVAITTPLNGATAAANQKIAVTATDNVAIASLKLYINGKLVSSANVGSINYTWNTKKATKGSNTIKAEATDSSGNSSNQVISVTVK